MNQDFKIGERVRVRPAAVETFATIRMRTYAANKAATVLGANIASGQSLYKICFDGRTPGKPGLVTIWIGAHEIER